MKKIWKELTENRWHLHIGYGFVLGSLLFLFLLAVGSLESLRWYEEIPLFFIIGFIIGLAFELFQNYAGKNYIQKLEYFYKRKILSRNPTEVDIYDALFTGVGFLICIPVLRLLIEIIF